MKNTKNLLAVLAVGLFLTGCNCVNSYTVIDNGDDSVENPYLSFEKGSCEPLVSDPFESDDDL